MNFPSTPLSYAVEITFACNNACPGCANVLKANRHDVMEAWRQIFDMIAPPDQRNRYAELFRMTGGEPTLHPEFYQIIEYLDTFNVPHVLFTNGRWEQPDDIIELYGACHNFIGMLVSLHGSTASAHGAFVGGDESSFAETCANIRRAAEAGLEVFTNTVLTRHNCGQIEEILALSQQFGAGYAVFNRYLGDIHPIDPTEVQLRQAVRLIEQLQKEGIACHVGDCIPPCFEPNTSLGSNGGIEHCAISPTGDVRPENLTTCVFGNLFEQSIEDIWQSEYAHWYRSQIPDRCLECVELPRCRGGARSVMIEYGLEGDRLMKEPIREAEVETLEFNPQWRPVPFFTVRPQPFGYLLARLNWSVPVTHDARPLIDAIDGYHTLSQLQEQFGDGTLEFLAHLYREDCIGFE